MMQVRFTPSNRYHALGPTLLGQGLPQQEGTESRRVQKMARTVGEGLATG